MEQPCRGPEYRVDVMGDPENQIGHLFGLDPSDDGGEMLRDLETVQIPRRDLALRELDVNRENQVRLTGQIAQTQWEVLRSEECLGHRVRMSSLLERREELEREDTDLADSPLLEPMARSVEAYSCGKRKRGRPRPRI